MKCDHTLHLSDICDYVKDKIAITALNRNNYVSTESMLANKAGIVRASSLPAVAQTQAFLSGDVLVSNIRPYFKKIWFAKFDGGCSNDVLVFRAKEGVSSRFLYYVLANDTFFAYSTATSKGTKMPRGDKTAIMGYEVPKITPEEQEKITAILSALDDKIELNNKINANLEQQAQAVFTAWFAEAKPSVSFVSLVRVLGGGTPRTSVAEFWEGEIPFFTPKDVYGVYTLETEKSLTDDGLAHCNSCLFPINTVFVTARGTVGKLTLAGRPMAMNQSCYALLGQEGYGQYFVYHLTQRVITHLKHKANGAVFDAIVTRDFESEFVPDIKPSEAANFELKVKPLYEAILHNYEENCRLSALRDMLLQRLISEDLLPLEFQ